MKSIKVALAICFLFGLFAANTASAFGIPGGHRSSSKSSSDAVAMQDKLVRTFVSSQKEILAAQSLLANAYGLKGQAADCKAQAKALQSAGTDQSVLKKTVDISKAASKAIAKQQAKQSKLSSKEKKYYARSLPHFASGVLGTRKMIKQSKDFAQSAKSSMRGNMASMATGGLEKLAAGTFIAKSSPSYSKNIFDVFRKTVMIAKKNDATIPSNATKALGSL